MPTTSGRCACGAIRYECSADPIVCSNCHCRDCQRASGSAFASLFIVWADSFRILSGKLKFYEVTAESGGWMRRGFCPDCGSPILIEQPHRPRIILIHAASLDDPSLHKPRMDCYVTRAQPWDTMHPARRKFDEMPPVPDTLNG